MVAVGGRYDALLRALWPLAHPPFHGHASPGVPYYGAVPPPGAVGATLNVERIIAGVSQQRAAAAAAAGQQAAGLLGVGGIGNGLESSKVGSIPRVPLNGYALLPGASRHWTLDDPGFPLRRLRAL